MGWVVNATTWRRKEMKIRWKSKKERKRRKKD
jgi:hypothetical protein